MRMMSVMSMRRALVVACVACVVVMAMVMATVATDVAIVAVEAAGVREPQDVIDAMKAMPFDASEAPAATTTTDEDDHAHDHAHHDPFTMPEPDFSGELPDATVYERGFVTDQLNVSDIVHNYYLYARDTDVRRFADLPAIGYLTPWNSHGAEATGRFARKFTQYAPVWYTIKTEAADIRTKGKSQDKTSVRVVLEGDHNVDAKWMNRIRTHQVSPGQGGILPRFVVEFSYEQMLALPESSKLQRVVIKKIASAVEKNGYDGAVFEMTSAWAIVRSRRPDLIPALNAFLVRLGKKLHKMSPRRLLVLPVRPYYPNSPFFGNSDFLATHEHVDFFQLMTYDYTSNSASGEAGPNAPIRWIDQSVRHFLGQHMDDAAMTRKVLIGINFYGTRYVPGVKPEPIVGREYIETLREIYYGRFDKSGDAHAALPDVEHSDDDPDSVTVNFRGARLTWESASEEHRIEFVRDGKTVTMYYPTLKSIDARLNLARHLNCGVAVWELGQGLPYFIDLF